MKKIKIGQIGIGHNHGEAKMLAVLEYKKALARIYVSSVEVDGWDRRQVMVSGSKGTINIMPIENECAMTYADTEISVKPYEDKVGYKVFKISSAAEILLFAGIRFLVCGTIITVISRAMGQKSDKNTKNSIIPILLTGFFAVVLIGTGIVIGSMQKKRTGGL